MVFARFESLQFFTLRRGRKNGRDGLEQDLEVEPQRPLVDIAQIQRDPVVEVVDPGAAGDLPEPGDAGFHGQPPALPALVAFDLGGDGRPGPDQRHLALEHIDQLWQLVEGPAAQPAADGGDPRVAFGFEGGAVDLVEVGDLVEALIGADETWCGICRG